MRYPEEQSPPRRSGRGEARARPWPARVALSSNTKGRSCPFAPPTGGRARRRILCHRRPNLFPTQRIHRCAHRRALIPASAIPFCTHHRRRVDGTLRFTAGSARTGRGIMRWVWRITSYVAHSRDSAQPASPACKAQDPDLAQKSISGCFGRGSYAVVRPHTYS